jgi:hypothetical protein
MSKAREQDAIPAIFVMIRRYIGSPIVEDFFNHYASTRLIGRLPGLFAPTKVGDFVWDVQLFSIVIDEHIA